MFLIACVGGAIAVTIGALTDPDGNYLSQLVAGLVGLKRTALSSTALGIGLATPWVMLLFSPSRLRLVAIVLMVGLSASIVTAGLVSGKTLISPYLPQPESDFGNDGLTVSVDPNFELQLLATLDISPIRVAVDSKSGRVFVSGYSGIAGQHGIVAELVLDEKGRFKSTKIIAVGLNRPHGLTVYNGDIYVSRSGQHAKWSNGRAEHMLTGAVTVLKDLDGDGTIDFFHDVIRDLPGARAPDYLHQNNALAFDSKGVMYITSGISSDGHPARHPWEGTILRALPPEYTDVSVFAKGLRNTFGLAISKQDFLYATDNDSQSGNLGSIGDKLSRVQLGDDFGHPYSRPGTPGVSIPAALSKFALAGITIADSTKLPAPYANSLYVASYGEGRVLRYEVAAQGGEIVNKPSSFAIVPAATDIAVAPNGEFYVLSFENRTLHRIKPERLNSQ